LPALGTTEECALKKAEAGIKIIEGVPHGLKAAIILRRSRPGSNRAFVTEQFAPWIFQQALKSVPFKTGFHTIISSVLPPAREPAA